MFNNFLLAATGADFNSFGAALEDLAKQLFDPLLGIAIALCAIWGVYLGFKFWHSGGDDKKREEAKKAVIAFVVGIIVIFAVAVAAPLLIGALSTWMETQQVM